MAGTLKFINPNYDFLGNSINYSISSEGNDKPDQGYENTVVSASIGTSFEQYRDVRVSLGLGASYDDLRTVGSASDSLKSKVVNILTLQLDTEFHTIKETEYLIQLEAQ